MRSHITRSAGAFIDPKTVQVAADRLSSFALPRTPDPVCLVGVDGSDASVRCLVWALRHAAAHGLTVEVLTVWPSHHSVFVHDVAGHFCAPRWNARDAQGKVIRQALDQVPRGQVRARRLENGHVAATIVRESAQCELVVLGAAADDEPGPLVTRISEKAECPVVVVGPSGEVDQPTDSGRSPLSTRPRSTARWQDHYEREHREPAR